MKKGALALFLLLTFASHGVWCEAARISTMADAARHHLRPHLQVQGLHETRGRKLLGNLGHMAGGGPGGGVGGAGGGRNTGGGVANTRPHNTKNGASVALPAPVTSFLALVFSTAILLSALSF